MDAIIKVLDPAFKTIVHIPSVNSRESLKDKHKEVEVALNSLGDWKGIDPVTGFHLIESADLGRTLKVADLVDDSDAARRSKVLALAQRPGPIRTTGIMLTSSSRSAWQKRASTGSGANMR